MDGVGDEIKQHHRKRIMKWKKTHSIFKSKIPKSAIFSEGRSGGCSEIKMKEFKVVRGCFRNFKTYCRISWTIELSQLFNVTPPIEVSPPSEKKSEQQAASFRYTSGGWRWTNELIFFDTAHVRSPIKKHNRHTFHMSCSNIPTVSKIATTWCHSCTFPTWH